MTTWRLNTITHHEMGGTSCGTVQGLHGSKWSAIYAAFAYADKLRGPVVDGYRRPDITLRRDETFGDCVQVGDASVDASYTLIYPTDY